MEDIKKKNPYPGRNLQLDSSSDEQVNLQSSINTYLQVEYFQNYVTNLPQSEKFFLLSSFPSSLKSFVQSSVLLHKSQLSLLLLGLNNKILNSSAQRLIVVKKTLLTTKQNSQLQKLKSQYFGHFDQCLKLKHTLDLETNLVTIEPFMGFSLSALMEYFGDSLEISYQLIANLFTQLINEVKFLHSKNIVHGDITPSNVLLLSTNKSKFQFKQSHQNLQVIEKIVKEQLQCLLPALFYHQQQQSSISNEGIHQIKLTLIDLENSWIERVQQNEGQFGPTQTLNFRSPQGLHKRGSFESDIWGMGHILLNILTGQFLFPAENDFTEKDLKQIFGDQKAFSSHIQNLISQSRHVSSKNRQIHTKISETINNCLKIDPEKRPSIEQLSKIWC